jgi:bifunctional non-homologous end joining protein LigD
LFKERDEFAGGKTPITERLPLSVTSGRNLEEIARQADRVWGSGGEVKMSRKARSNGRSHRQSRARRSENTRPRSRPDADRFDGVRFTHPDKLLYPDRGLTKRDLAQYYKRVSEWMLPHVAERPLALLRCPQGSQQPCFFQKHPGTGDVPHLRRVNVSETSTPEFNLAITDTASLIELVQMGVLEVHVWGCQARNLEKPDRLIFDLDPDPAVAWGDVVTAAREVRLVLENHFGLTTFLKTTGGKGLHVVVPIQARTPWEEAKQFCQGVARLIVQAAPDRYVATMSKAARKGKIFIDYLRNGRGATAIAPYSTRNRPGATVSVPISWSELSPKLRSDQFTVENLFARLSKLRSDPWAEIASRRQSLTKKVFSRLDVG